MFILFIVFVFLCMEIHNTTMVTIDVIIVIKRAVEITDIDRRYP